jgi:hypothetical protein
LKTLAVTAVVKLAVVEKKMNWALTTKVEQLKDAPALFGLKTDSLQARRHERALSILVSPPSTPGYRSARKAQGRLYSSRGLSLTNRDLERLASQFPR